MDELEARLVAVPYGVIADYLNHASRLLQLQQFDAPPEMITRRKQNLTASWERLMREINSRSISVSQSDLSTYLTRVASGVYKQSENVFREQQRIMPVEEAISVEAAVPSVHAMISAQRYRLLLEKVLSGEFELVPKDTGN